MVPVPALILYSKEVAVTFAIRGYKVLSIMDSETLNGGDQDYTNMPNFIHASVLLPPYESIAAELDHRYEEAKFIYHNHLSSKECMDYLSLIALAIMKGIPIGVYFGPMEDIDGMVFPRFFFEFMYNIFGISFRGDGIDYGTLREEYIPINAEYFLLNDMIDIAGYYDLMPTGMDLTPKAIQYLDRILRPCIPFKREQDITIGDLNEYFKDLIKRCREAGKYLVSPFVRPVNVI